MTVLSMAETILGIMRDIAIILAVFAYTLWGPNQP